MLYARELIELGNANLDEISYQLGGLLQAHGTEAQDSIDTAEWLANEIGAVRGIKRLFATGGDLQIALRRSQASNVGASPAAANAEPEHRVRAAGARAAISPSRGAFIGPSLAARQQRRVAPHLGQHAHGLGDAGIGPGDLVAGQLRVHVRAGRPQDA